MRLFERFQESLEALGESLKSALNFVDLRPPSFEHLTEDQAALAESLHDGFVEKAQRGYFDEDVVREYRSFMFRWGLTKNEVDQAQSYMESLAASALPSNRAQHRETQDRYWANHRARQHGPAFDGQHHD